MAVNLEELSYLVTVVGLPFAIAVFIWDQRRERRNEEEEIFQRLADEYSRFLRLVLQHSDLQLRSPLTVSLTPEQRERRLVLFELLISLFERAYILVYETRMSKQQRRLWQSWEDWIGEWLEREDFRLLLDDLLRGEDPEFVSFMHERARLVVPSPPAAAGLGERSAVGPSDPWAG